MNLRNHARMRPLTVALVVTLVLGGIVATLPPADATTPLGDRWSSVGTFRTADGWYASPIHATVLTDGRILFIGIARATEPASASTESRRVAWIFDPPAMGSDPSPATTITEIAEPVENNGTTDQGQWINDDLYCAATVLDDTGRMITAGGTRVVANPTTGTIYHTLGLTYQTIYDGTTWRRLPGDMLGKGPLGTASRWYPTLTRLPDRRILVTGGIELVIPVGLANRTLETLDRSGHRALLATATQPPEAIHARDYTAVSVLPAPPASGDLLMMGDAGVPLITRAQVSATWLTLTRRPGSTDTTQPNWGSSTIMLPIRTREQAYRNGSVMVVGGDMHTDYEHTADVLDPIAGTWAASTDLEIPRHHPSTVLLADSRVLVVNGHDMMGDQRVTRPQYIDPLAGNTVTTSDADSGVIRGYHSVAALLPDGRVLVGGGRDVDTSTSLEKPTYQIYSPDYLVKARPQLLSAPTAIGTGSLFSIVTTGRPSEVVLLGLAAMTHSSDFGQRAIQLPIGATYTDAGVGALSIVGGPANPNVAPPGYYLLAVLDQARTPSVATIVKID